MQKSSPNNDSKISLIIDGCESFLDIITKESLLDNKDDKCQDDSLNK